MAAMSLGRPLSQFHAFDSLVIFLLVLHHKPSDYSWYAEAVCKLKDVVCSVTFSRELMQSLVLTFIRCTGVSREIVTAISSSPACGYSSHFVNVGWISKPRGLGGSTDLWAFRGECCCSRIGDWMRRMALCTTAVAGGRFWRRMAGSFSSTCSRP